MSFELALFPPIVEQECFFSKKNKKSLYRTSVSDYIIVNKTCQGYARKRTLKPAGFSFSAGQ
jgi:hypothetical protein